MFSEFLDFSCVSAAHSSGSLAPTPISADNLALLLPFGDPPHHSTPDHQLSYQEVPGTSVDADGIRHSIDKSMDPEEYSNPVTETAISCLAQRSAPTSPNKDVSENLLGTSLAQARNSDANDTSGDINVTGSPSDKICNSPFSSFLNRTTLPNTEVNAAHVTAEPVIVTTSQPSVTPTFATSSDLQALEQRMQVLVSEVSTAISSRLLEQFAISPVRTTATVLQTETSGTQIDSSLVASPVSTIEEIPSLTSRNTRRGRKSSQIREGSQHQDPQGEHPSASKRPRPRLQLTGSMYRKHPIFKFFVTAPIDAENNPHKWRCRVCQIELSLKTKGSLEILSHYRTDTHLLREHRIRMEIPGLPLYGRDEVELSGQDLDKARERAELAIPITPVLGECYLLPGQRRLPVATDDLEPCAVICSQVRILLIGLQNGGNADILSSLWANLSLEVRGPTKVPQYDWRNRRIFVCIILLIFNVLVYLNSDVSFTFQGILVHMFRPLLSYSTTSIGQSGQFSLKVNSTFDNMQVFLIFWSGNVLNQLLAEVPNVLFTPKWILQVVCSFLAVFTAIPPLHSLSGFDGRTSKSLVTELVQAPAVCIVPTFSFEDLDKALAGPTVKILDRYDYHSVLQFLLMKLRTATGSEWLNDLPELRKVSILIIPLMPHF